MEKVVITGGLGAMASHIKPVLSKAGYQIRISDIKNGSQCDLTNFDNAKRALDGWEVVVHLAGIPHPAQQPFGAYFRTNVMLSHNILAAAKQVGSVKRIIYASSSAAYGTDAAFKPLYLPIDEEHPFSVDMERDDPDGIYHYQYPVSKRMVEMAMMAYAKTTDIEMVIIRSGPMHFAHKFFSWGIKQVWARKALFIWSDPRDLAQAFKLAIETPGLKYEVFNIMGTRFPEDFNVGGQSPDDWAAETYPDAEWRPELCAYYDNQTFFSSQKAQDVLGWIPGEYAFKEETP